MLFPPILLSSSHTKDNGLGIMIYYTLNSPQVTGCSLFLLSLFSPLFRGGVTFQWEVRHILQVLSMFCCFLVKICKKNKTNANILWTTEPIKPKPLGMILEWSPFKIISDIYDLYPRWPKLLNLEIYSNG